MTTQEKIEWKPITPTEPPSGSRVLTKIDDSEGPCHEQVLTRRGRLWFGDGGMYVYYDPTHWAPVPVVTLP